MSCCKNQTCKNTTQQNLPTSNISANDALTAAKAVVAKLLQIAHFNNKILPSEISPLLLANLIAELLQQCERSPATVLPQRGENFVLKFGPNKAYELHLPAGTPKVAQQADPQKMFNFELS